MDNTVFKPFLKCNKYLIQYCQVATYFVIFKSDEVKIVIGRQTAITPRIIHVHYIFVTPSPLTI